MQSWEKKRFSFVIGHYWQNLKNSTIRQYSVINVNFLTLLYYGYVKNVLQF